MADEGTQTPKEAAPAAAATNAPANGGPGEATHVEGVKPGPAATLVVKTVSEHEERLRALEGVAPVEEEKPAAKSGALDSSSWFSLF